MAKTQKSADTAQTDLPPPQSLGSALNSVIKAVYGQKQQQVGAALLDASSAMEAAAEDLDLHDRKLAAEYTEATADWLQGAAQGIIRMEPEEATGVLADMAENNPAIFLGSAALGGAGLVLWLQQINRRAATGQ